MTRKKVSYKTLYHEMTIPPTTLSRSGSVGGSGRKDDMGKPRPSLVPPFAELEVVNVLTHGADRYGDENWHKVLRSPGGVQRYTDAALRHIGAFRRGSPHDPDSSYHHLAHAICCLLFILEGEMLGWDREEPPE